MTKLTSADYPIALSLDLEYWWCSEFLRDVSITEKKEILREASSLVLNLLDKYDTRATFFVLGSVAEKYPDLIRQIHHKGHEIAAHGYEHKNIFEQNQQEFEEQLRKTTEILTSITSERPIGYRAPNFSLDESSGWVYDVLKKLGYKYSSSIFPFKTKLYGLPKAPLQPYSPSPQDLLVHDPKGDFIEFPLTVLKLFGKKIPVSGGFYFRIFPIRFTKFALKKIIKKRPAIFYFHLRDVYKNIPRIKNISFTSYFFHYFGLKNALKKLESLLQSFEFKTVKDVLRLG
jgi:polysaccharide deacetylase family protein (PEP-CTERM system associated)